MRYENQVFVDQTVRLDNNEFIGCLFKGCLLLYAGGRLEVSPMSLDQSEIRLQGAALQTSQLINSIQSAKAKAVPVGAYIELGGVRFTRNPQSDAATGG